MQDQSERGICATCPFWQDINGPVSKAGGGGIVPPGTGGACRRVAPQHIARVDAQFERLEPHMVSTIRPAIWPMTASDDWCGDHPMRAALAFTQAQNAMEAIMPQEGNA